MWLGAHLINNLLFSLSLSPLQALQSLFPRLPEASRGGSLFDRTGGAPGPEGDKLRLDAFPFLGSGVGARERREALLERVVPALAAGESTLTGRLGIFWPREGETKN